MDNCYLCGRPATDTHHIFNGPMRTKSEEYGAVIRVCRECHDYIHKKADFRLLLKKNFQAQIMFEKGWSVDDFRQEFHKSYLMGDDNDVD